MSFRSNINQLIKSKDIESLQRFYDFSFKNFNIQELNYIERMIKINGLKQINTPNHIACLYSNIDKTNICDVNNFIKLIKKFYSILINENILSTMIILYIETLNIEYLNFACEIYQNSDIIYNYDEYKYSMYRYIDNLVTNSIYLYDEIRKITKYLKKNNKIDYLKNILLFMFPLYDEIIYDEASNDDYELITSIMDNKSIFKTILNKYTIHAILDLFKFSVINLNFNLCTYLYDNYILNNELNLNAYRYIDYLIYNCYILTRKDQYCSILNEEEQISFNTIFNWLYQLDDSINIYDIIYQLIDGKYKNKIMIIKTLLKNEFIINLFKNNFDKLNELSINLEYDDDENDEYNELIELFKNSFLFDINMESSEIDICMICNEDDVKSDTITTCKHQYCNNCINHWLRINSSCPKCRCKLFQFNLLNIKAN